MVNVPLVSICIPVFERERYLGDAVASALSQTYQAIEVIVVDNASSDGSYEIARSFADPRVRVERNDRNIGQRANLMRALSYASGECVLFLSSDDLMYPHQVEQLVKVLSDHPNVGFAFCNVELIDGCGRTIGRVDRHLPEITKGRAFVECSLSSGENPVHLVACLVRRAVLESVGEFAPVFFYDWPLWLRCAMSADVGFVPEALAAYRVHGANEALSTGSPAKHLCELVKAIESVELRDKSLEAARRQGINKLFRVYAIQEIGRRIGGGSRMDSIMDWNGVSHPLETWTTRAIVRTAVLAAQLPVPLLVLARKLYRSVRRATLAIVCQAPSRASCQATSISS